MSSAATAKSIFWATIEAGSLTVLSLLTIIILARLLGPAEFGLAALALAIVQILILFVEAPFTDAIVQRQNLESAHVVSAFWATCVIALILIVGCVAAAGAIAEAFDDPRLASATRWLALSVGFSALSCVPIAQLRRNMQFKQVALRSVL
ncbi:MAG: oligosaccharide flippase family protein, partial [Acidobacteriales bacterium]|nr:oligosaccharide flippase family protein [Terriglobales bacterium]